MTASLAPRPPSPLPMAEAEAMARIHAASFTSPRPWSATEFALMAESQSHQLTYDPGIGLAVVQIVLDEAELLTIAVTPDARGRGAGTRLLDACLAAAQSAGAARMFLDVAADNSPALALYRRAGFTEIGRRKNYYRHADRSVDALLMERAFFPG